MKINGIYPAVTEFNNQANLDGVKEVLLNPSLNLNNYFNSVFYNDSNKSEQFNDIKKAIWLSGITPPVFSDAEQVVSFNTNNEYAFDLFCYAGAQIKEECKPIRFYLRNNVNKNIYWLGDYYKNNESIIVPVKAIKKVDRSIYNSVFKFLIDNELVVKKEIAVKPKNCPSYLVNTSNFSFLTDKESKNEYFINKISNIFNAIKEANLNYNLSLYKNENSLVSIKINANYDQLYMSEDFNKLLYYYLNSFFVRSVPGERNKKIAKFATGSYRNNLLFLPEFILINKNIFNIVLKIVMAIVDKYTNEFEFDIDDKHAFAKPDEIAQLVNMPVDEIKKYYSAIKAYGKSLATDVSKFWHMSFDDFIKEASVKTECVVVQSADDNKPEIVFNEKDTFSNMAKEYLTNAVINSKYKNKVIFYGFKKDRGIIFSGIDSSVEHPEKFKAILSTEAATKCFGIPYSTRVNDHLLSAVARAIEGNLKGVS